MLVGESAQLEVQLVLQLPLRQLEVQLVREIEQLVLLPELLHPQQSQR